MGPFESPANSERVASERVAQALAERSDEICRAIATVCHFLAPERDRRSGDERRINRLRISVEERRSGKERRQFPAEHLRELRRELCAVLERNDSLALLRGTMSSFTMPVVALGALRMVRSLLRRCAARRVTMARNGALRNNVFLMAP